MSTVKLSDPFHPQDIEWRIQRMGWSGNGPWVMALAYVTNRAIQNRLDECCTPFGWQNEYRAGPSGGVICGISVWDKEKAQWITKWDGSDNTQIEATKGGLSGAMKRAGSQWGIGRYLYGLDATFATCREQAPQDKTGWVKHYDKDKGKAIFWQTPQLPDWALPSRGNG